MWIEYWILCLTMQRERQVLQLMRDIFFSSRQTEYQKKKKKKRNELNQKKNYIYMFCVASAKRESQWMCVWIILCAITGFVQEANWEKRRTKWMKWKRKRWMMERAQHWFYWVGVGAFASSDVHLWWKRKKAFSLQFMLYQSEIEQFERQYSNDDTFFMNFLCSKCKSSSNM